MSKQELAEELQTPIIRKFHKRKEHSFVLDNIWGADLANMQLISKFNKKNCSSLCVIDIFCKSYYLFIIYSELFVQKIKTHSFQNILDESYRKPIYIHIYIYIYIKILSQKRHVL